VSERSFKKYWRLIAVIVLLAAVVAAALLLHEPAKPKQVPVQETACGVYRDDKTVAIDTAKIKVEEVKTQTQREKGLSGRPCIEPDRGMLFVFDHPGQYAIWMKDMRFPIDIVWISAGHKTVGLEVNVAPSTYPDRFVNKDQPAQYVLELKANRAKELNIGLGTTINF
jgi:uncharacterized membrane protein (UPF0127 family)